MDQQEIKQSLASILWYAQMMNISSAFGREDCIDNLHEIDRLAKLLFKDFCEKEKENASTEKDR